MKTIKEIAETANVSKTSIYNLIKKHDIPTFKRGGKTFLDEISESLVLGYYSTEQYETISNITNDSQAGAKGDDYQSWVQDEIQDGKLNEYTKVISILENERSEKNKIIKELLQSNKILSQALAADKVHQTARLMVRDNKYTISHKGSSGASKGFFNRIFRKKFFTI